MGSIVIRRFVFEPEGCGRLAYPILEPAKQAWKLIDIRAISESMFLPFFKRQRIKKTRLAA